MCAHEGYDDGRVDEDKRVRDDDEWRAGRLAAREALATLASSGEIIAALEEQAGNDWEDCGGIR